ncbi:hypothetical protein OQX61_12705 [Pedobacter sp. PLR]|uniref:hypothetical protein n=1 Tax=Pedobacter sp. PLR TaxID=2994465 RepID=UPI002246AA11|nr:hypothetical protein [Pedobacter sp. PLR]MCX2452125.1 hypothetical protein [Pedobacter sp. PLR]
MKKNILFAALLFGALLSCKKKSFTEEPIPPTLPPIELGYSKLTTEQNKQALEQNGLDFIKKINTLPEEKFISLIERLGDLDLEALSNTIVGRELESIARSAKSKQVAGIFSAVTTNDVKNTTDLSNFYGIYNWNSKNENWDKTASTSKFEVHYPSTVASKTNDALLTVSYTASKAKLTVDEEEYELPAATNITLTVGEKEELKLTGVYEYKTDATPTKVDVKLNLGTFQLVVLANNDSKILATSVALTKDKSPIFSATTNVNLNEKYPALEDLEQIDEIVKSANMTFEVMNIKITGQANIKAIQDEYEANKGLSQKDRRTKEIATLNKNTSLFAVYKDKNEVFAKNEFVRIESTRTDWNYNPISNRYEPTTYAYFELEPRLVFNDESKMTLKTFFGSGFTRFVDEFEIFTNKF